MEKEPSKQNIFQRDLSEKGRVYAVFKYISKEGQDLSVLNSIPVKQELEVFLDYVSKYYDISDHFTFAEKCKEIADKGFNTNPFHDAPYEIKIGGNGIISIRGVNPESLSKAFESSYTLKESGDICKLHLRYIGEGNAEFHCSTFYRNTCVMREDEYGKAYRVYINGEFFWRDSNRIQAFAFTSPTDDLKAYLKDFPSIVPYCLIVLGHETLAIRNPEDPTSLSNATILGRNIPLNEIPDLIKKLPQGYVQQLVQNSDLNEYYQGLKKEEAQMKNKRRK